MKTDMSLPNNWNNKRLGDYCEIIFGQSPPSTTYNSEGIGLPFFQGKTEFGELHPVATKWCSLPGKIALPNDILISVRAPVGSTNIADNECCIGRGLAAIRHKNYKYIYYFLKSIETKINELGTGTTFKAITGNTLRDILIPVPSDYEQNLIVKKIEELFYELDASRQQLETTKKQIKTYKDVTLKLAFEGKLTNRDINEKIPQNGWKWKRLHELVNSVEYGSAAKSEEIGKIPVLRMGNIQNGRFDWSNLVYTNDDDEISKYLLHHNDVLFNRTNSPELVGKTAIYKSEKPAIFAGYLIRINVKEELLNHDYLAYYLNSPFAKKYGSTVKTDGVNQSNINGQKLKSYPIPYCDLQQQKLVVEEIETRLFASKMLLDTIEQVLSQTEALKQVILKQAFEGKLVRTQTN